MHLSWQVKYMLIILLCLSIFCFTSNIVVHQMNDITGMEIVIPFYMGWNKEQSLIELSFLGEHYVINDETVKKGYSLAQQYIQNFASEVQYNLVPRVEFMADLLMNGTYQLMNDVEEIYNNFR